MDHDFLDGIDEHFERLMKEQGNGRTNGRTRHRRTNGRGSDRLLRDIIGELEDLSGAEKNTVLEFIHDLKQKADRS